VADPRDPHPDSRHPDSGGGLGGAVLGLIAPAARSSVRDGITAASLRADVLSGIVVGIVALPLSMALAIAIGVSPQHGLYTAIVAGVVTAIFGGSRVQISGPTAAFVVILVPIVAKFGIGGLCVATLMAGVILIAMGFARLGRMISFIPYPVTTGFTAGIAVVIAILQVRDGLGLDSPALPHGFIGKVQTIVSALPTAHWPTIVATALTLALLVLWPRINRAIPAPLIAVAVVGALAWLVAKIEPSLAIETVATRFGSIPQGLPTPSWPWHLPGPDGEPLVLNFDLIEALLPSAFAIAMLGAIESLLSAVVADGMSGQKHDPDAELVGQGLGNVVAPFLGGFAATGAIARTATNVRSGGRTPIASVVHALFILVAVLVAAPLLGHLPMAAMAGLLLIVAWNMSEARHFFRMIRVAPRSDTLVLLTCFTLTVTIDMVVAVTVGVLLASLLFIRRMAEVSSVRLVGDAHPGLTEPLPPSVLLYEIAGPLFFGAAQKALSTLESTEHSASRHEIRVVLLDLRSVPAMDATGLVNLESTIRGMRSRDVRVIIGGVQQQPMQVLRRAGIGNDGAVAALANFDTAVAHARRAAADNDSGREPVEDHSHDA